MKSRILITLAAALVLPALNLNAGQIIAEFSDVDDFTDFTVSGLSEVKTLSIFQAELNPELERLARKYLGEDDTLTITFIDIDMAGDIQPWRNRYNADIRYVEDIYPPRLKFTYSWKDAEGNILDEGETFVSDIAYRMTSIGTFRSNHMNFYYELDLLSNWMRKTARTIKSANRGD